MNKGLLKSFMRIESLFFCFALVVSDLRFDNGMVQTAPRYITIDE